MAARSATAGLSLATLCAVSRATFPVVAWFWGLLDHLWMLWDRENQCLHDKAVQTLVVPVAAYPIRYDQSTQQSYGAPPQPPPPGGYNPNP